MYTVVKALVHNASIRNKWVELADLPSLLNTPVESVNAIFGRVQLIMTHNTEPDNQLRYDFIALRQEFASKLVNPKLGDWLAEAAKFKLTTVPFRGIIKGKVFYCDAIEGGFGVDTQLPGGSPNDKYPDEVRSEVVIKLPAHLTPDLVRDNCLFTVAGLLHRPYATVEGVYLIDGGTTVNRSGINTCGVLSFQTLGGVKTHSITEELLSGLPEYGARSRKLDQPIFVRLPGFDSKKQTAMLSLMGVLIPMGKTFRSTGDDIFEINLAQYNYLETFYRVERMMSFKDLKGKIEQNKDAPTQLSMFDVASREFLLGVLTCSQSFLITVNNNSIFVEHEAIETTQNSMAFLSHFAVDVPLVDKQGLMVDYLITKDADMFTIDTPPTDLVNRRMFTSPYEFQDAVDSLPNHQEQMVRNRLRALKITGQQF